MLEDSEDSATPTPEVNTAQRQLASTSTPISKRAKKRQKLQHRIIKMEQVDTLKHRRGLAKGKVTKILNLLLPDDDTEGAVPPLSEAQHRVYKKKLEAAQQEYSTICETLLPLVQETQRAQFDEHYEAFDELYDQVSILLEEQLITRSAANPGALVSVQAAAAPAPASIVVHQPLRIPIPTFDGRYESWPKFKVMFKDVVDKSPDSAAVKLYHLDKALMGSAAGSIDVKTINEGDYAHAWEILEERYGNKRHTIDSHIQGLLHLKKMTKESHVELRHIVEEVTRHVEGLKYQGQEFTGVSELILVHLITTALEKETRRRWESTVKHGELPKYESTMKHLKEQCFVLERCEPNPKQASVPAKPVPKTGPRSSTTSSAATTSESSGVKCDFCSKSHLNHTCPEFKLLSNQKRMAKVRDCGVCFNCLRKGHRINKCPSERHCSKCERRHHTLLHADESSGSTSNSDESKVKSAIKPKAELTKPQEEQPPKEETVATTASCCSKSLPTKQVLLLTAVVDIMDSNNKTHPCRVLLDSGSQANMISKAMVESMGIKQFPSNVAVVGVNGTKSHASSSSFIQVRSRYSSFSANVKCLVTESVTADLPTTTFDARSWELPPGVQLADPTFYQSGRVDMLLGNQLFLKLLLPGEICLAEDLPVLRETRLGWVIGGVLDEQPDHVVHSHNVTLEEINQAVRKFWEVEEYEVDAKASSEELECEQHFLETHRRDTIGRYIVQLPLKESVADLGDSRSMALRRFYYLEKRFAMQPDLKRQYDEFINEYEQLGHCKEIKESDDPEGIAKWYLPHHAVLKPSNTTTKCRVVFDGSAEIGGLSLNDVMKIGPLNQSDLISIVLRFRVPRYVLATDVAKMYRQVKVADCHSPLQRIFWRSEPSSPIRVLELTTVTYGTASAPFLATRALQQLAIDEEQRFPVAAKIVQESFYVDNALFGFNDINEAAEAEVQLIQLLNEGGFHLHKWASNCAELLEVIPEADREELVSVEEFGVKKVIKTLGLLWDPSADELMYVPLPLIPRDKPTKRQVLSLVASMFDPTGTAAPVVLIGKLLVQRLWKEEVGWNDDVPSDLQRDWEYFLEAIRDYNKLSIPRLVVAPTAAVYELHGFADASQSAYGACIYIRSIAHGQPLELKLLCARSKLVPRAVTTIPRKELLAALLLYRLVKKVLAALKMPFKRKVLWSDSQVVLAWLKKKLEHLEVFVRNRVSEIKSDENEEFEWKYVRTSENPADIVSRGMTATNLATNDLWWNGPSFLRAEWYDAAEPVPLPDEDVPELHPETSAVSVMVEYERCFREPFTKFESFRKLQRIMAYVLRFIRNCKEKRKENRCLSEYPKIPELRQSLKAIIRVVQYHEFASEIANVQSGEPPKKFKNLDPFLEDGLLRVGGRLRHSQLPFESKHPWILPHHHPVVQSLIACVHKENLHIGPTALLATLRRQFWISSGRSAVRKVIWSCVRCFKTKPSTAEQFMGDLPVDRTDKAPAFLKVGLDFAGPFLIKQSGRKATLVKGYICIFVCMVTKGIHLEVVENLSAEAFIAALLRFVSRRGLPEHMFSDNGTNFVGAKHELHELYKLFKQQQTQKKIHEFCQPREITWTMIPPSAPHMGGLWEAGVKSVKTILKKVCNTAQLQLIEFATLTTQIEALLNSRPLYAHSEDPADFEPLTPGHFMIDRPLTAIPEPTYDEIPTNRLSRWQYVQSLRDNFWQRWRHEYLKELQTRGKWIKKCANIRPRTVVLIKEDNLPPQSWKLGRIEKTYPGSDNLVRVVDVRTSSKILRRPVHKLAPLPILDNQP